MIQSCIEMRKGTLAHMDKKAIYKPLAQFFNKLSGKIQIKDLIIFGSYAEGMPTRDSDIDVVVISDDFQKIREDKRLKLLDSAAKEINPMIQAWGFTSKEIEQADEFTTLGHARVAGIRWSSLA